MAGHADLDGELRQASVQNSMLRDLRVSRAGFRVEGLGLRVSSQMPRLN